MNYGQCLILTQGSAITSGIGINIQEINNQQIVCIAGLFHLLYSHLV